MVELTDPTKLKVEIYYSLRTLKTPGPYPPGVHVRFRELYLKDDEFLDVMGMTKEQWMNTPTWKQATKKKAVGLF